MSGEPIAAGEVRRIARLARLALDESAVEQLTRDLGRIVGYVSRLEALDLEGEDPVLSCPGQPPAPDAAEVCQAIDELAGQAPAMGQGHFLVPRVVGE